MKGFKMSSKGGMAGHSFPSHFGFSGSAGRSIVRMHTRKPPSPAKMATGQHQFAGGGLVGHHDNPTKFSENMSWSDYKKGGRAHMKEDCYEKGGRPKMHLKLKKGALHSALGVPQGEKIPAKKLAEAKNSDSPLMRKRAVFAENAKHWHHKAKGGKVHSDEAMDKKLIRSELAKRGLRKGGRMC